MQGVEIMLKEVEYKELVENKYNPRKRFDDAAMKELVDSIDRIGLLEPLVVRSKGDNGNAPYEVVCGIRRYRALGEIKNGKKIPVNQVKVDDKEAQILSICENTARQNLNPIEEGNAYANYLGTKLSEIFAMSFSSLKVLLVLSLPVGFSYCLLRSSNKKACFSM